MQTQPAVMPAEQFMVQHRYDEQVAVRQPAHARGPAGDLERFGARSVRIQDMDLAVMLIREPQLTVMPARPLGENETGRQSPGWDFHPSVPGAGAQDSAQLGNAI